MSEDIELRRLRLRKMMKLMAEKKEEEKNEEEMSFDEALKIVRERLVERGDEVLKAALSQYPEITKKIILALAKRLRERGEERISGGALLRFFDYLGLHVKIETSIRYYKKGEYKSIRDLLK